MPHCIIEYSHELTNTIQPQILIKAVHQCAEKSGLFSPEAIKTRAISYQHYTSLRALEFIHVNVRLLAGRSDEQKKQLSAAMLDTLEQLKLTNLSLSVEITDMHSESYAKSVFS